MTSALSLTRSPLARRLRQHFWSHPAWWSIALCGFAWTAMLLQGCQDGSGPNVSRIPDIVGATSAPFYLGKEATNISFAIHPPTGPALLRADLTPRRVFLNLENVTSDKMAPSYNVYLNMPPGNVPEKHPDLHVGGFPMFGLVESSRSGPNHTGDGLSFKREVTEVYTRLTASRDWDAKNLRVTFVPKRWDDEVKVQVGRVSLYFE